MERNHYRRRHGHHGGRYFLGHSSGRCSFRPENAFRTPRPENHRPWQSRLLVEHRIKNETNDRQCFEFIFNSALSVENIALAGTRGWIPETSKKITEEDKVIILREQGRLERSLIEAEKFNCEKIFAILHYPPFDEQRRPTKMMEIMKSHGVTDCIYGHIHGKQNFNNLPKELEGIQLHLTSSDYLDFKPLLLTEWNES